MFKSFIIEGPDNAGKSTLAEELSEHLAMPVYHQVRPTDIKEFIAGFVEEQKAPTTIFDRSMAISQLIYDSLLKRLQIVGGPELTGFVEYTTFSMPVIICLPPPEVVLAASPDREEMVGVADNRAELYELYSIFAKGQIGNKNVVVYDYTIHTIEDVLEWMRHNDHFASTN